VSTREENAADLVAETSNCNELVRALTRLLDCPALNEEAKEGEDLEAIEYAEIALAAFASLQAARTVSLRGTVETVIDELEQIGIDDADKPINGCDAVDLLRSVWMDLKVAYEEYS
jgi:hypothetical protein